MNFDYTYITLFGYPVFEPLVIVTNAIFFTLCFIYFRKLTAYRHRYGKLMGWFLLMLGSSSIFGATAHAVHYQLGRNFFDTTFFIMNALSIISIYYCFRTAHIYSRRGKSEAKVVKPLALLCTLALLIYSFIYAQFLVIKIAAGIVLLYCLIVHYIAYARKNERGSGFVVTGICVSFFSIIVHSLHFSIHEWFNYKDISHVFMIAALVLMYKGVKINLEEMGKVKA